MYLISSLSFRIDRIGCIFEAMKRKNNTYMQVITGSDGAAGEILLYGFIGQDYWWWPEKEEESITDIAFRKAFNELAEKHDRINIRINSPGGSLMHGNAIISTIMNSKVEVHTYNDGMAASMAASIWLASKNRHMGVNATLMLHNTMNGIWGNAKELRQMADTLDKFTGTTAALISQVTDMDEDEVKKKVLRRLRRSLAHAPGVHRDGIPDRKRRCLPE